VTKPEQTSQSQQLKAGTQLTTMLKLGVFGLLFVLACLQHFALTLPQAEDRLPDKTDGLVVPTGGQARIQEGLRLLHNGTAHRMLITGVGQDVSKQVLATELKLSPDHLQTFSCCVDIDKAALDTKGNAEAALIWAKTRQFTTLRLVTANYHLPRAHLEFSRLLPDHTVTGWPVTPPDLQARDWYWHWPTIRLLTREYAKYLFALIPI